MQEERVDIMKIIELIEVGTYELKEKENARNICKILLAFILKKDVTYISIYKDKEVTSEEQTKFKQLIKKIKTGIPLQYITNTQNFMGMDFYVNENVLIPQPDTEVLVEEVIELAKKENKYKILDLCTGSGAIAVSISKILNIQVTASDISKSALEIARKNALNNHAKVQYIQSDLFNEIYKKFEIIVSNPPYIKTDVINNLSQEVQNEPFLALDGGKDGLCYYRKIATQAKKYLVKDGYLALEIGFDQKDEVEEILKNEGYTNIYSKKDYGNNDRIIIGKSR